jgi:hypothetical protein
MKKETEMMKKIRRNYNEIVESYPENKRWALPDLNTFMRIMAKFYHRGLAPEKALEEFLKLVNELLKYEPIIEDIVKNNFPHPTVTDDSYKWN